MNSNLLFRFFIIFFSVLVSSKAFAADTLESWRNIDLSGSARSGFWTSSRKLDDEIGLTTLSLWLRATKKPTPETTLVLDGWIRNEDLFENRNLSTLLREGYFDLALTNFDFRLGKQIVAWGRADRLNPTDNLTPKNLTLLVPEDDDQRYGALIAKAVYHLSDFSVTAMWLPEFEPNIIPINKTQVFAFQEQLPENSKEQWAIKIDQTGELLDWSLSYFDGYDLNPDLRLSPNNLVLLQHNRIKVLGADAAGTFGRYGIRFEGAYAFTEYNPDSDDPSRKKPFFYAVLGVERNFFENFNVNIQYFARIISNYNDPNNYADPIQRTIAVQQAILNHQYDPYQQGMSFRFSNKWINDSLEAELSSILIFNHFNYLLRPKITYAFSDLWKGTVGADIYKGTETTYFGILKDNSALYAEIRYGF